LLRKDKFAEPKIVEGRAQVVNAQDGWLVVAGDSKKIEIETRILGQ